MFSRLLFLLLFCSLGVISFTVWTVLDQPIRGYVIEGELTPKAKDELQRALSEHPVDGILSTSLADLTDRVRLFPWARHVSLRRLWPDRLVVSLRAANPVVQWGDSEYVSAYGDLMSLPDVYPHLPKFEVALATPVEAMQVYWLLDQISAADQMNLSGLQQDQQGHWTVRVAQGPDVLLGAKGLKGRMQRYLRVHRQVLALAAHSVDYVDARYDNGVAVKYSEQATVELSASTVARQSKFAFSQGSK